MDLKELSSFGLARMLLSSLFGVGRKKGGRPLDALWQGHLLVSYCVSLMPTTQDTLQIFFYFLTLYPEIRC